VKTTPFKISGKITFGEHRGWDISRAALVVLNMLREHICFSSYGVSKNEPACRNLFFIIIEHHGL